MTDSNHRNELFTEKISAGRRTYFIDVKESKDRQKYLIIRESDSLNPGQQKNRVMIFEENFQTFAEGLKKAFNLLGIST